MPDYLFILRDKHDGSCYHRALIDDEQEIHRLEEKADAAGFRPYVTRLDSIASIDKFLDDNG